MAQLSSSSGVPFAAACCCLTAESTGAVALATLAEAYQVMANDHSFSAESRSNLHNFHSTLTLHYPGSQILC